MIERALADDILREINASTESGPPLRKCAMELLSEIPGYNWSGIYRLEGETLVLDEYVGDATDHTQIPVGKGVCGTAVAEDANQVIPDVRELTNYLSCSAKTRSEIVVLIRKEGRVLGQIDIDGHEVGAFDETDEAFLNRVAEALALRWD